MRKAGVQNLLFIMLLIWKFSHTLFPHRAASGLSWCCTSIMFNVNIPLGRIACSAMSVSVMNMLTTADIQTAVNHEQRWDSGGVLIWKTASDCTMTKNSHCTSSGLTSLVSLQGRKQAYKNQRTVKD